MKQIKFLLLSNLLLVCVLTQPLAAEQAVFVENGKPKAVYELGRKWTRRDGYLECYGTRNFLYANKTLDAGDFSLRVRLSIEKFNHTAAAFVMNGDYFGFDGEGKKLFVEGSTFGQTRFIDDAEKWISPGKPFCFEVLGKPAILLFRINGKDVWSTPNKQVSIGKFGLRPWRATMRVYQFSASGNLGDAPLMPTMPKSFNIPAIDLSKEKSRQVIVERKPGQYLGHPSTVLLRDNRAILCTYPLGHGGPSAVLKKSTDGGLTWSGRLPVPDNWKTARNCPCIHRLIGPDGTERLFVFEGNGAMRQAVSLDNGKTWTPLKPNGLYCVVAPITIIPVQGGKKHLMWYHRGAGDRDRSPLTVWQSSSSDGSLTWDQTKLICKVPGANPCEPAVIRSPSGKQLLCLMRENARWLNSLMIVSNDEGKTWSKPRELPASLTGDRHMPRYAPDGRLVVTFRDMAAETPTKGDFVAWVGTYDDIINGREGQYRLRLLDNKSKPGDTGYAGLELLPDGTFVATTYCVLEKGEKPLVVSVRFKLKDTDAKAALLPLKTDVFVSGEAGYKAHRAVELIVTKKGTLLAFCEGHKQGLGDTADQDTLVKRSNDGGKTWSRQQVIWDDGDNNCSTACPVVDQDTGIIWLLITWNHGADREPNIINQTGRDTRRVFVTCSEDDGGTWARPKEITTDVKPSNWTWYATGPGVGIQLRHRKYKGRLIIPCDHIEAGTKKFYSHVIYSDDHGRTWKLGGSAPTDMVNECQVVELADGQLMLNMRNYDGSKKSRAVSTSADGGITWSAISWDPVLIEPHCQASFLRYTLAGLQDKNRLLFSNPANTSRRANMTVRLSYDEGKTWPVAKQIYGGWSAYSCLTVLPDGNIGLFYERDVCQKMQFIRFSLAWLTDGKDSYKAAKLEDNVIE